MRARGPRPTSPAGAPGRRRPSQGPIRAVGFHSLAVSATTLATDPLALPGSRPSPRLAVRQACLASALAIVCWVGLAAWTNQSQLQDSLEQFVWGQSLEWGYWKHPPLTSWLMWAGLQVVGPVPWVTYLLGGLVTVLTMLCTTRLARLLAGDRVAVLTALLLALHYGFTRRAQMFNHNTVLVACVALAALATFQAVQRNRRRDWALAGVAAGLALMAKYQAAVPLAGLLLAVLLSAEGRRCLPGLLLASACAALVVLPHGIWALQHGLQTVSYAVSSLESGTGGHHPHRLRLVPVLAMQAKYFLTMGGFAVVLWAATCWRTGMPPAPAPMTPLQRRWFAGLVLLPMAVLVGAAAGGVQVQSHWGFQASQFLVVPIAIVLSRRFGNWGRLHTVAWLAMQVVAMGVFVAEAREAPRAGERPGVCQLPAADIAREVAARWRALTGCELHYLRGSVALAGMVSAYSGERLLVLEDGDPAKSPWIDVNTMRASGFVDLREHPRANPTGLQTVVRLPGATPVQFALELHPPQQSCHAQ